VVVLPFWMEFIILELGICCCRSQRAFRLAMDRAGRPFNYQAMGQRGDYEWSRAVRSRSAGRRLLRYWVIGVRKHLSNLCMEPMGRERIGKFV